MEQMTRTEWENGEKLSLFTIRKLGFKSASEVKNALRKNGCRVASQMSPINVEGELK